MAGYFDAMPNITDVDYTMLCYPRWVIRGQNE
jgi:hypothetical protein